jgi:UDP-hydrolysing UDP-N-acetyl-D-glucosamine 2-epimerase
LKRKVAVFTGNRAEYGLQFPILRAISEDDRLEPVVLAGGAHLDSNFGRTLTEIERDGFKVAREVHFESSGDDLFGTTKAIGSGILSLSPILADIQPDWMLVYGDRFESFAAMVCSTQMRIPTAHVEGGDYTEGGALDDSIRHAMTKLAHLHFATNAQAAERILRMGEEPSRVLHVGHPAIDLIAEGDYASDQEILKFLNLDPIRPVILFCQHSIATQYEEVLKQLRPSLEALARCCDEGCQVVITYPNNDAGGKSIIREIEKFAQARSDAVQLHRSLGRFRFHGLLHFMGRSGRGVFAGNSSALIKETPAFGCPAVNIGERQRGRLRGDNVVDANYSVEEIHAALKRCIFDNRFRKVCATGQNPYGAGNAGARIAEVLATYPINNELICKRMTY